jgi:cell division protein FtsA
MNGVRLEVDAFIIEGSTPYLKNLSKCFEQAKIEIESFVLTSLAAARAVLSKRQKELGVCLVDIGGGTTSVAVFEENDLLATIVIPVGGNHITNDIAIGLRTSVDVAEKVKLEFGNARPSEINKKEDIDLGKIDSNEEGMVSRYHVAEIIEARLEEIFNLVNKELKAIGKNNLLPAGAVITGATAKLPGVVDLAKDILGLPAQTGFPLSLGGLVDKVDEPSFATPVGLLFWGMENEYSQARSTGAGKFLGKITDKIGGKSGNIKKWFEKFLP